MLFRTIRLSAANKKERATRDRKTTRAPHGIRSQGRGCRVAQSDQSFALLGETKGRQQRSIQHRHYRIPKSRYQAMIVHPSIKRSLSILHRVPRWHGLPWAKTLRSFAASLLIPMRCLLCGRKLEGANCRPAFCLDCTDRLVESRQPCCPRCGAFAASPTIYGGRCPFCRRFCLHFDACRALGHYRGLSPLILRMKHQKSELLAKNFANLWQKHYGTWVSELQIDSVIAVPMHWRRVLARGGNSASAIAAEIAQSLELPQIGQSLRRVRNTAPQEKLNPFARFRNVRNAFNFPKDNPFLNRRILVIDDVLTTGATASELARVLKAGGASFVAVGVIARAQGHDR